MIFFFCSFNFSYFVFIRMGVVRCIWRHKMDFQMLLHFCWSAVLKLMLSERFEKKQRQRKSGEKERRKETREKKRREFCFWEDNE